MDKDNVYTLLAKQRISQFMSTKNCTFRYAGCYFVQINIPRQLPYLMFIGKR